MPRLSVAHYNTTGHITVVENFNIVGREEQNLAKSIKEAISIPILEHRQIPSTTYMG